jgi:hypothetical protein
MKNVEITEEPRKIVKNSESSPKKDEPEENTEKDGQPPKIDNDKGKINKIIFRSSKRRSKIF